MLTITKVVIVIDLHFKKNPSLCQFQDHTGHHIHNYTLKNQYGSTFPPMSGVNRELSHLNFSQNEIFQTRNSHQ